MARSRVHRPCIILLATFLILAPQILAEPATANYPFSSQPNVWFRVRVDNISDGSTLPTALYPGAWAVHTGATPLFTLNQSDPGAGLEALAEDGSPTALVAALVGRPGVLDAGVFDRIPGGQRVDHILPGQSFEFLVHASDPNARLSLATTLGCANDVFAAPGVDGIPLFGAGGSLEWGEREITGHMALWDAGTEANQAPGMGPVQPMLQPEPGAGRREGVVGPFQNTTRGLPLADGIVDITVTWETDKFVITLTNVSVERGAIVTAISPVFFATHNTNWRLFNEGHPLSTAGMESLVEDGSPFELVSAQRGKPGVGVVSTRTTTTNGQSGPAGPGKSYQFSVTADPAHPYLTLASMILETNDAFLSFGPSGLRLVEPGGNARPAAEVQAEARRSLTVWDAGTEANEVPGVGEYQPPRQPRVNTGDHDETAIVRRYQDPTNDLGGPWAGRSAHVEIARETDGPAHTFRVTVTNTSNLTFYPMHLSPLLAATHVAGATLFTPGQPASTALERLAEDGNALPLQQALRATAGFGDVRIVAADPMGPGTSVEFTVTMSPQNRYLSLAAMVMPSNDTFLALGPGGVELVDAQGNDRLDSQIAADVATKLAAWDAGTERDQAGAAGPHQALRQPAANTGLPEGPSVVRALNDPVWRYPTLDEVIRVQVQPVSIDNRIYLPFVRR